MMPTYIKSLLGCGNNGIVFAISHTAVILIRPISSCLIEYDFEHSSELSYCVYSNLSVETTMDSFRSGIIR